MDIKSLAQLTLDASNAYGDLPAILTLQRAWPQADGQLALEYRTSTGDLYPGQYHSDPEVLADQAQRMNITADRSVLWGVSMLGERVLLQPHGLDARMPALAQQLENPQARLISHRPAKRAVVQVRRGTSVSYLKFFASAKHFRKTAQAAATVATMNLSFRTADVQESNPEDHIITFAAIEGSSLHDICHHREGNQAHARRLGAALADLHNRRPDSRNQPIVVHSENAVLEDWYSKLLHFNPELADELMTALTQHIQRDQPIPGESITFIHRDFHDKQIFLSDNGVGIIDVDTLSHGDPYIDLANLLAHLELRYLQQRSPADLITEFGSNLLAGYGRVDHDRLNHYLDATRLRLVCVYFFRPRWHSTLQPLIARLGHPFAGALR